VIKPLNAAHSRVTKACVKWNLLGAQEQIWLDAVSAATNDSCGGTWVAAGESPAP